MKNEEFEALLARLEAAEEVARWANAFIPKMEMDQALGIEPDEMPNRLRFAYEVWRKACGK